MVILQIGVMDGATKRGGVSWVFPPPALRGLQPWVPLSCDRQWGEEWPWQSRRNAQLERPWSDRGLWTPRGTTHLLLLSHLPKCTRGGDTEEGRKGRYLINVSDLLGRAWHV